MQRASLIAGLLLAIALTCSCQKQSDIGVSPTSYSQARHLSSSQQAETQAQANNVETISDATVVSIKANLRETPNTSALVVQELEKGVELNFLEDKPVGPWYRVRQVSSGKTGWIHGNTIKLKSGSTPPATEQSASGSGSLPPATLRQASATTTYSGEDTYINSFGEEVPRPRKSSSIPDGASARCRDGTYSFSRSRRGTCSHHGGVAEWL